MFKVGDLVCYMLDPAYVIEITDTSNDIYYSLNMIAGWRDCQQDLKINRDIVDKKYRRLTPLEQVLA